MEKKTKLTISGNPKKSFKNFGKDKSLDKKSVIIDSQSKKPLVKGNSVKQTGFKSSAFNQKKNFSSKHNLMQKNQGSFSSDFEKRKLAEQRATKRLRGDSDNKEKKLKLGSGTKKRELKLTVSRALSDEI